MGPSPLDPPEVAAPARPRTAARPATRLDPDIDPDFPDIDDVDLHDEVLSFPAARTLTVVRSTLTGCRIDEGTDAALDATDTTFVDVDLTGRTIEGLHRVAFVRCRLGGADFGDARLRDVDFDGCVLDLASMRGTAIERMHVNGGRVDGLDLSGARLVDVTLQDISLAEVALDGTRLERVDLTDGDLAGVADIATIRGATISEVQAMALSVRLARAAGVSVARPS